MKHLKKFNEGLNKFPNLEFSQEYKGFEPSTVNIVAGEDSLEITFNGDRHHERFNTPVTWSDDKYKKIYDSLSNSDGELFYEKVGITSMDPELLGLPTHKYNYLVNKDGNFKSLTYKIYNLKTVFDNNYEELISINKDIIDDFIKSRNISIINKVDIEEFFITDELTVYRMYISGFNLDFEN